MRTNEQCERDAEDKELRMEGISGPTDATEDAMRLEEEMNEGDDANRDESDGGFKGNGHEGVRMHGNANEGGVPGAYGSTKENGDPYLQSNQRPE